MVRVKNETYQIIPKVLSFHEVWRILRELNLNNRIAIENYEQFPTVNADPYGLAWAILHLHDSCLERSIGFHTKGKNIIVEISYPIDANYRPSDMTTAKTLTANHIIELHLGTVHTKFDKGTSLTYIITLPIIEDLSHEA